MEKVNVYLDDVREAPEGFILVKSMKELVHLFEEKEVCILSLDHDLGENKPTGYDFVKYFCLNNLEADYIYLHTSNPVGRENMYKMLLNAQKTGIISDKIKIYNHKYK